MSWSDIEDALQAFAVSATGLGADHVVWANQAAPEQSRPFATLKIDGPRPVNGAPDELRIVTNLANPAGQEVEQTVVGNREIGVTLQVLGDSVTGASQPREYAGKAQTAARLPANLAAFRAAGLALIDVGPVLNVPELVATGWRARAVLDLRFHLVDTAVEKTGYIATIGASYTISPG